MFLTFVTIFASWQNEKCLFYPVEWPAESNMNSSLISVLTPSFLTAPSWTWHHHTAETVSTNTRVMDSRCGCRGGGCCQDNVYAKGARAVKFFLSEQKICFWLSSDRCLQLLCDISGGSLIRADGTFQTLWIVLFNSFFEDVPIWDSPWKSALLLGQEKEKNWNLPHLGSFNPFPLSFNQSILQWHFWKLVGDIDCIMLLFFPPQSLKIGVYRWLSVRETRLFFKLIKKTHPLLLSIHNIRIVLWIRKN